MKNDKTSHHSLSFKACLIIVVTILCLVLVILLFLCDYILVDHLYNAIQINYFSKKIIEPMIDRNANLTQAYNIRIKSLKDILLESRLINIKILLEFTNTSYDHSVTPTDQFDDKPNYYMLTSNLDPSDTNHNVSNRNMFNLISYFAFIFQSNFDKGIQIQELIIIDKTTKNYLTYCDNIGKEYLFFQELSTNDQVLNFIDETSKKYNFSDFIVHNQYQYDSYLNYLKFISFKMLFGSATPYDFILGMRLKKHAADRLFNIQKTNMTVISYQYSFAKEIEKRLHYISSSDFLDSFYNYAMINMFEYNSVQYQANFDQEMTYINSKLSTYFKLLSQDGNEEGLLYYKLNWKKELTILSKIFYSILQQYNDTEEIDIVKDADCNLKQNEILCEAQKGIDSYSFDISNYTSDPLQNINNETDDALKDFYRYVQSVNILSQELKYGNSKIVIETDVFIDGNTKIPTKFLIYNQSINNLLAVNIEIIENEFYTDSKNQFVSSMNYDKALMKWLLVGSCCIVFALSFILGYLEVNTTIQRLKTISKLKTNFFICKLNMQNIKCNTEIQDKQDNDMSRWSKTNIYKEEYFKSNNKLIINTAYNHLLNRLEQLNICKHNHKYY